MSKNIIPEQKPLFTVVIATYNRGYSLEKSIESLLMQTEHDWECIIIDDGSDEPAILKIDYIIRNDKRFKYIFRKNCGPYISKNYGASIARGFFVTFLDDDDLYHPQHLELRKRIIFQNPTIDFIYGGLEIIGDPFVPDCNDKSSKIHLDDCYVNGTFFVNTDKFNTFGGFDNEFGCDLRFYQNMKKQGCVIGKTNFKTYVYNRQSPDSICNQIGEENDSK